MTCDHHPQRPCFRVGSTRSATRSVRTRPSQPLAHRCRRVRARRDNDGRPPPTETPPVPAVPDQMVLDLGSDEPVELLPFDGSALFHPRFLTDAEADALMVSLLNQVPWEQRSIVRSGQRIPQPRLVAWFGDPGVTYTYSGLSLESHAWIPPLEGLKARCETIAGATFNSCLANLYRDGHDYVGWHADDEPELGPDPVIASVSLGAERRFHLRHRATGETVKVVLQAGSLVVMSRGCQRHWVHQVPMMRRVTEPRINLTFRSIR